MTRIKTITKITAMACAFVVGAMTTGTANPLETRSTSARAKIEKPTEPAALTRAPFGYILMDAASGEVISHQNADTLFIPASLSKIPTTLLTLSALGTERRFETKLFADGAIVDGVLQGDLHLVGSGDPSLKKRDMIELMTKLRAAGVRHVSGRYTYNTSALPQSAVIDKAQPDSQSYNPPVSGLNVDLNVRVVGGRSAPVRQPGRRAARMLRYFAFHQGITMPKPVRSTARARGYELATHISAPVSQIAAGMMERSTNLTAESLGVLSVAAMGTTPKSLAAAADVTGRWVKAEAGAIGGKGWRGFRMANHSGLSTRSRATPRQIASILRLGYMRFGSTFTDLHKENRPAGYQAFSLRGKFGTMQFVRGYGGFLTVGGREMIFTIMTNDHRRRALADAGRKDLPSKAWMKNARELEQAVLSQWITGLWPGGSSTPIITVKAPSSPLPDIQISSTRAVLDPWVEAENEPDGPAQISTHIAKPERYIRTSSLIE